MSRPFVITQDHLASEAARLALDIYRFSQQEEAAAGIGRNEQQSQRIGAFSQLMRMGSAEIGARPFMTIVARISGQQLKVNGGHHTAMRRNATEVFKPLRSATYLSDEELEASIVEAFPPLSTIMIN